MNNHVKNLHVLNIRTSVFFAYTFSLYSFSPYGQYAKCICNKSSGTRKTIVENSLSCSRCAVAKGFIIHVRGRNNTYLSAYEISHSQLSATICVYRLKHAECDK